MESIRNIVRKVLFEVAPLDSGYIKKNRTVFPDIGNFFIQKVYFSKGQLIRVDIFSPDGFRVGQLDMDTHKLQYTVTPQYPETSDDLYNWQTIDDNFRGDIKNAVRLVFLKSQKPLTEEFVLVNGHGVKAEEGRRVTHPDIGDFSEAGLLSPTGELIQWNIYSKGGERLGELRLDGTLKYRAGQYDHWETATNNFKFKPNERFVNLKNAMRYVFLQAQKPVENSQISEKSSIKTIPSSLFTRFPDIGNYAALREKDNVTIYNEDGLPIVRIISNGHIRYREIGTYLNSDWKDAPQDANFGFEDDGIKQAARWYFLNTQKPLKDKEQLAESPAGSVAQSGHVFQRLTFKDIANWKAVLLEEDGVIHWLIIDNREYTIGVLKKDGLIYDENDGDWETADRPFTFDEEGVKQATRYIFLKTQKPLNEEHKNYEKIIKLPDVGDYVAKKNERTVNRRAFWQVYDKKGNEIIRIFGDGSVYITGTGLIKGLQKGHWSTTDVNFGFDEGGVKQVARWYFLKAQKPLKEDGQPKHGTEYVFPDVDNWKVTVRKSTMEYIYLIQDNWNLIVGEITKDDNGTIHQLNYLSNTTKVWENSERYFSVDEAGLKKAVSFVYLKRQKPLKKQKKLAEVIKVKGNTKLKFKDIGGWTAELNKDEAGGMSPYWMISDKSGWHVGDFEQQGRNGVLHYLQDNKNTKYYKAPEWIESNNVYKFNTAGLKSAVRFAFLQRQQPLKEQTQLAEDGRSKELTMKPGDRINFPDIGGWYIVRDVIDRYRIAIYSAERDWMGVLQNVYLPFPTGRKATLFYGKHIDDEGNIGTGWMDWEHYTSWNNTDIKNAVRFVYLQNQQHQVQK